MSKMFWMGVVVLLVGGAIFLLGPKNIVEDCPLFGSGVLASPCSQAMVEEQARRDAEFSIKDAGGLLAGFGAVLTGIGALRRRA